MSYMQVCGVYVWDIPGHSYLHTSSESSILNSITINSFQVAIRMHEVKEFF